MTPEFPRPLLLERIGAAGHDVTVSADATECAALAIRMHLPAIQSLVCRFHLRAAPGDCFVAEGQLRASVTQTCIVSLDDFPAEVAEDFVVHFVPAGTENEDPDLDAIDEICYAGDVIDIGEAAAEQLALGLDPYPRKPGAALEPEPGLSPENPFARLAALRRRS